MKRLLLLAALAAGPAPAAPAPADGAPYYLRLDGDRLTLRADGLPLRQLLADLSRAGVLVRADPAINPLLTARLVDRDLQKALDELIRPHSFVLGWDFVRGPLGDLPRLAEVQIFEPGGQDRMQTLQAGGRLRVVRGPGGIEYVADEVLVAVKPGTKLADFLKLLERIGGSVAGSAPGLGVCQVLLQPGTDVLQIVQLLKKEALIEQAEPNYVSRLPRGQRQLSLDSIGSVPKLARGAGSALAVLDSGLLSQPALADVVAGTYDAMNPGRAISDPDGHGTQMALIASGAVAPQGAGSAATAGVPVLAIRAFDDEGATSNFALLRALEFALVNGAKVASLSWGSPTESDFIQQSLNYAMSKGMVVVAAAGNEPTGQAVYPAAYPGVISVAALQPDGTRWPQSNYGATVDLSAPGTASFPVGHDGPPGNYAGTSIATAYVAGQIAQYYAVHPQATRDDVVRDLGLSLSDAGDPGPDPYYGQGVFDAAAAQKFTAPATP